MNSLQAEFVELSAGLLVCTAGALASVIAMFRLKNRDFTLLNFGLFAFLYGLRKLVETETMRVLVGFPFTFPYFHGLLTYMLVIPISAFLVNMFGRGLFNSMVWVFRSSIVYVVAAIAYDLVQPGPLTDVAIYRPLVVVWAAIWIVNLLFSQRKHDMELHVLQGVLVTTLLFLVIDQLLSMGFLSWSLRLEQPGFAVLFIGLGFIAVHHFLVNERSLHSMKQEIEIAWRIQKSNLPASINFPQGVDIAARYVPMSMVAGDFYDFQIKDETGMGILIADVSGHGVGAALVGSMLKVCFASQAHNIADPARVLTEINRILQGKIETSFVTACSLYIDFKSEIIRYSIAGHPPPFLMRKSNSEIIKLTHAGTILGPFPNTIYENASLNIEDDRLVLYTDGITEANNKTGEFFGEDRLVALIKDSSSYSVNYAADLFVEHISEWSGRPRKASFDDDFTLIIIDIASKK